MGNILVFRLLLNRREESEWIIQQNATVLSFTLQLLIHLGLMLGGFLSS